MSRAARLIAFYLPQFHPIPENDEWWGKGFTEWANVVCARPRFRGHYQPHLPSELGFYDLRLPEVREAQAALAQEFGISGFCYHHYWFQGKRLLSRIFDDVLESGVPAMNFCLCWANESWRRNWDGATGTVLMEQTYSPDDDVAHIRWLTRAFSDRRYIRVAGKPLFIVFRAQDLPDPRRTTAVWRDEAHRAGVDDLYLCCAETNGFVGDPATYGFDAAVEFPPHQNSAKAIESPSGLNRDSVLYAYEDVATASQEKYGRDYIRHPCVVPGWDNSARRRLLTAHVVHGSTPEGYGSWLRAAIVYAGKKPVGERLVFLNAWNEWAESAHLEPDQRYGRRYLEATRGALRPERDDHSSTTLPDERQTEAGKTALMSGAGALGEEMPEWERVEVNEAVADAWDKISRWQERFCELEAYTKQLMREQHSLRFLSARLVKEIGSRVLRRVRR